MANAGVDRDQLDHPIVLDVLAQHLAGQCVVAWVSDFGLGPVDDGAIFSTVLMRGSVCAGGESAKMSIVPLPTFIPYLQQLAEDGGFDEDDRTYKTAASEILARMLGTYATAMRSIRKEVFAMCSDGDMPPPAFTFELDSNGSVCNLVFG